MSSAAPKNIPTMNSSDSKPKKKRKPKKKGGNGNSSAADSTPVTPTEVQPPSLGQFQTAEAESDDSEPEESDARPAGTSTETSVDEETATTLTNGTKSLAVREESSDTVTRFEALVKDRDALRLEVTHLRQSLEEIQSKHEVELDSMQGQLQETQGEKEHAEEQYQNLLGKVNTIRSQLTERLKADAEDLSQARTRIEELEEQRAGLQEQYTAKSSEHEELTSQNQAQAKELSQLRNRATLSQQNWLRERDELVESEAYLREEFENTKQAMHDWEVLAMEERSVRRDLTGKIGDLEEQVATLKESYERAASERDSQANTVDGLQRALQEIQTERKRELREVVESSQGEMESLRKELAEAKAAAAASSSELESMKRELERALPFEKEVKEKNLLIGKLRHEAVILNDHLTKALRFLKKGKPEDNVDRQIVTNHFLHFLALDRSDPKKFQILQLIAAYLAWTDEQRTQAGLTNPTAPSSSTTSWSGSLRLPGSPLVHRTPSTPALASEYFDGANSTMSPGTKESLAELWQNFLEQEASQSQGTAGRGGKSRTGSASTISTPRP